MQFNCQYMYECTGVNTFTLIHFSCNFSDKVYAKFDSKTLVNKGK